MLLFERYRHQVSRDAAPQGVSLPSRTARSWFPLRSRKRVPEVWGD